jgi:hypothetical protein
MRAKKIDGQCQSMFLIYSRSLSVSTWIGFMRTWESLIQNVRPPVYTIQIHDLLCNFIISEFVLVKLTLCICLDIIILLRMKYILEQLYKPWESKERQMEKWMRWGSNKHIKKRSKKKRRTFSKILRARDQSYPWDMQLEVSRHFLLFRFETNQMC